MRPIDADELLQTIQEWDSSIRAYAHPVNSVIHEVLDGVADVITDLDTIDYAPVKRGEWLGCENYNDIVQCSGCGLIRNIYKQEGWNYCPNCGADMCGKKDAPCS